MDSLQKLIDEWRSLDADGSALLSRRGEILSTAKQQLEHGSWLNFLKEIDIPRRSAQRYIRVYEIQRNAPTLAHLGLSPSKWEQLGRLDDDQLNDFVTEYRDSLSSMSVRELKRIIDSILNQDKTDDTDEAIIVKLSLTQEQYDTLVLFAGKEYTVEEYLIRDIQGLVEVVEGHKQGKPFF